MRKSDMLAQKIAECQKGEADAFVWLLKEYGPRLYSYFFRTTGSAMDAEDLLQEIFVKLLESIAHYHHKDRFENWLFRIAGNLARDRARRQQRPGRLVSLQGGGDRQADLAAMVPSKEPSAEQRVEQADQLDRLQEALLQLPELDREIILRRHYGQLSFKEIAEQFGIPIGTALAKVHRGLKSLRRMLNTNEPS